MTHCAEAWLPGCSGHERTLLTLRQSLSLNSNACLSGFAQAAALAQDALQREVEALQVSAHRSDALQQLRDQQDSTASGQWQSG